MRDISISALSLIYTHTHSHTHLCMYTRTHTVLKDRPSDLPRRSLLCCLATRLSPTVESTHAPLSQTDSDNGKSEPIKKRSLG